MSVLSLVLLPERLIQHHQDRLFPPMPLTLRPQDQARVLKVRTLWEQLLTEQEGTSCQCYKRA